MTRAWPLWVLLGALGCRDEPPRVPEDAPQEPAEIADGRADAAGCRDWSTLDLATLPALPKSPHAPVLEQVWRIVLDKHFDPTIGCLDWPSLRMRYATELTEAKSRRDAYATIDRMLAELGQSHFRLFGGEPDDTPPLRPASPPLQVRWIEEELIVVKSEATGHTGSVPAGARVLAIDDTTTGAIVERARARVGRPSELAFAVSRAAAAHLSCDRPGNQRRIRATDPAREDAEIVRMVTCEAPEGELVTLGNLRDIPTRVEHRMLDDGAIGYLHFNVWMLPMVKRVSEAVADLRAQGMKALILDLRGNPGGVGQMAVPVARLLLRDGGSLGALQFRDFRQEFNVEGDPDPFAGPVVVLIDAGTASTSEIFVQGMKDLGRITVVGGEPSAGAALPSLIEELPGGAVLQYVVGEYHSPKGIAVEGKGVVPDVLVTERRSDFAAGKDPVLTAAIEHLRKAE